MDAAVQWVRAALDSARAIVAAEALVICAAGGTLVNQEVSCGRPSMDDLELLGSGGGRWFRVELAHGLVLAALPAAERDRFSGQEEGLLLHVAAILFGTSAGAPAADAPLQDRIDAVEREAICGALRKTAGNKARAARLLGITRGGLYLKMKRHRLE